MICLRQRNETISSVLLVEREGIQIPVSYVSRPLQGMEICYTLTKNMAQALIHTTRSLRAIFRKHKVKVVTDGPMEEILKLSGREGWLAKWAAKVRTYDISCIQRKEVEESIVKKFFGQGEQVQETPDANEGEAFNLSKKLQAKSTPTPRSWRYKETIRQQHNKRYKKEIMDAIVLFHRVLDHTSSKKFKLQSRSVKRVGNHKVGISQSGSIGRYQNKTISGRDKQRQEGKSDKQCT
ncbi:reverse transcriptase domain-containing protein [Tanacetum coccineum]